MVKTYRELRVQYDDERKNKPVAVSPSLVISLDALTEMPTIRLDFIVGGGAFLDFDYRIVGGPDNGKRVTLLPWRPEESLEYGATIYNGSREEYERCTGYSCRPMVGYCCYGLHAVTVAYLQGALEKAREYDQSRHYIEVLERQTKEAQL